MKKTLLFAFSAVLISCSDVNDKQLQEKSDTLQIEVDNLRVEIDSLLKENRRHQFEHPDVEEETVINSLREKPELIPMEPVLGGTMRFGNIEVIEDGLVVANYNDGHVEGTSLFRYRIADGELSFNELYTLKN